ncbi:hypothetical protein [Symbioplanes lichenis]|uniref:hypothetical protein n=1 Tax=Symbioplanes lichenis TaxID=1629072 RepID=UPI00273911CC|nr:hypothetical protein [Actinoplanes lichenis]
MNRRTLLGAASWLGAAAVAVLVGLAAISIIGAGLTSSPAPPLSAADVARQLEALPAPETSATASLGPAKTANRTFSTRGGTVVARCDAEGGPEIVSMSPRPGFELHDRDDDEGEFRSTSDNHDRVKFRVSCAGDRPQLATRSDDDD